MLTHLDVKGLLPLFSCYTLDVLRLRGAKKPEIVFLPLTTYRTMYIGEPVALAFVGVGEIENALGLLLLRQKVTGKRVQIRQ